MKLILLGISLFIGLISHSQTIVIDRSMLFSDQFDSLSFEKGQTPNQKDRDMITRKQLVLLDSMRKHSNLLRNQYFANKDTAGINTCMEYQIWIIRKRLELNKTLIDNVTRSN